MAPAIEQQNEALLAALRNVPVLADLPEDEMRWFASRCSDERLAVGENYVREGDAADRMFVVLEGELLARTEGNRRNEPLFLARAGTVTGVLPFSRLETFRRTVRATEPVWAAMFPKSGFDELLRRAPKLGQRLVGIMIDRVRDLTVSEQQYEKLQALGRLSAGFAHELNNPASAAGRATANMQEALHRLLDANIRLDEQPLLPEQRKYIACAEREFAEATQAPGATPRALDPLARSDREEAITAWLEGHAVGQPWQLAPTLVEMNWSEADLEDLASRFDASLLECVLSRLTATVGVGQLLGEIRQATARISELIGTLREYSYMDQAPEKEVDIHPGINATLGIVNHRMTDGVALRREFDRSLPPIPCDARALNLVWMNLIENALDAMGGAGELVVRTRREPTHAVAEIVDNGPGIPEKIRTRIFEPFFTTKGPGGGTGLGLDTVYRIVRQHHGNVTFESKPGETIFQVRLPLQRQYGI